MDVCETGVPGAGVTAAGEPVELLVAFCGRVREARGVRIRASEGSDRRAYKEDADVGAEAEAEAEAEDCGGVPALVSLVLI